MCGNEFILHMTEIDEGKLRISKQKSINFHSNLVVSIVFFSDSVGTKERWWMSRILMSGRAVISSPMY